MTTAAKIRKIAARILLGFVAFMILGNAAIVGIHIWAQKTAEAVTVRAPEGIHNFHAVDGKVWRGGRPTLAGYKELAERGVSTIVDLRAEVGLKRPVHMLERRGVRLVKIPMRDGQAPSDAQVARFLRVVRRSEGRVYVHCMAGVGRTGTMVAAYLVDMKDASSMEALEQNLSVGPPSLEQIAFVADDIDEPNPLVTGVSRVLDAPRRIWSYLN
jgi:protein-tyrosine phosphatase